MTDIINGTMTKNGHETDDNLKSGLARGNYCSGKKMKCEQEIEARTNGEEKRVREERFENE